MIKHLEIKNFKSHVDTKLELSNMNVLTGLNGMGKSSVIQALLLLRQSHQKNMLSEGLELKDDLCNVGVAKDAIFQSAQDDIISFAFIDKKGQKFSWSFKVDEKKLADTFLKKINSENKNFSKLSKNSIFNNKFQYISAFRIGPVQDYEKDTSSVEWFCYTKRY